MDRCEEERLIEVPVSRRKLIQAGATTGLMAAVGGLSLPFSFTSQAANKTAIVEDKAVWSSCTVNCGSRCLLRLHVKDDSVYWVESDTTGNDEYGNHQVGPAFVDAPFVVV